MHLMRSTLCAVLAIFALVTANPAWPEKRLLDPLVPDDLYATSPAPVKRGTILRSQKGSFFNLPSLSQKRSSTTPLNDPRVYAREYEYHAGPGAGITVIVVDTGFDTKNHHERYMNEPYDDDWIIPKTIPPGNDRHLNDPNGHGTCVASLIAGNLYGVSKDSELVIAKIPRVERDANGNLMPSFKDNQEAYAQNMIELFEAIKSFIIKNRLDVDRSAVINLSVAIKQDVMDIWGSEVENKILQLLKYIDSVVHIVAAADNTRVGSKDEHRILSFPGLWHHELPNTVFVGAADQRGDRFLGPLAFPPGRIVWAIGKDIECAGINANGYAVHSGTSQAAPIVSGLLAYLKALPDNGLPGSEASFQEYAAELLNLLVYGSWKRPGAGANAVPLVSNQPLEC